MRRWLSSTRGFRRFTTGSGVRPSRRSGLLRATLLQLLYSIRSERQLVERLEFDMLFRWFVGLVDRREGLRRLDLLEEPRPPAHARDRARVSVFAPRPAGGEGASERRAFFGRRNDAQGLGVDEELPSQERLGRRPGERPGRAAASGRNGEVDFRKTKRSNATHASTTDKDARPLPQGRRARRAVSPISATP